MTLPSFLTVALVPLAVIATPALPLTNITDEPVLPPSRDTWYQAPDTFQSKQNGAVLRIRTAAGNLAAKLSHLSTADQILYRTADSHDYPTWAVTTVLVPRTPSPWKPAFVSYQMPYESPFLDASPSYQLCTGGEDVQYQLLDRMLANGWHVIVPDYQGPPAAFGAGRRAGHAVLDSVRAVRSLASKRYHVQQDKALYVAWGYSGGALATIWAYKRRAYHAEGLGSVLSTFAVGGLPADIPQTLRRLDGTASAGLAMSAIAGLMSEYRVFNELVQIHAKSTGPFNVSAFDMVRWQTAEECLAAYAEHKVSDYFDGGLGALLARVAEAGIDKQISLQFPPSTDRYRYEQSVLVYHAVQDEVALIKDVDDLVTSWCREKHGIEYRRLQHGTHRRADDDTVDFALEWMAKQLELKFKWSTGTMFGPGLLHCNVSEIAIASES